MDFDVLDRIFFFLTSDPECLTACSEASPVFFRMAEKYRYYHIVIHTGETQIKYRLEPSYLTKLLSDKPRIANYVRVLQVEFPYQQVGPYLDQITPVLPMFPLLECIVLSTPGRNTISWEKDLSQDFRKAVESCLHLPTLKEVHVECLDFPLSTLDNHGIDCFSFSGTPKISKFADTTYPQLLSLSVEGPFFDERDLPMIFNAWTIQHSNKLQSLKCDYSNDETILGLLACCSDTLTTLDLTFTGFITSKFATTYDFKERHVRPDREIPIPRVNLFSLPHLQHLTIRAAIYFYRGDAYDYYESCNTFLPAAMEILKTASSLQQLTIEINIDISSGYRNIYDSATIDDVDFSPLTSLAESPASIRHIDVYFNFENQKFTQGRIVSLLAKYGGLTELIGRGALVIHVDAAPTFLDRGASKRSIHQSPRSILRMFASTYY